MKEYSEKPGRVPTFDVPRWLGDVVRRCLLQAGAMRDVEEKLKKVSRRCVRINSASASQERR